MKAYFLQKNKFFTTYSPGKRYFNNQLLNELEICVIVNLSQILNTAYNRNGYLAVVALHTVKIMLFVRVNHGDRINQVSKWGQKFINLKENPIKLYDLLGSR